MESILLSNGESIQQEKCAARSTRTGKRFDTLGGRRLKTLRAGWICPDLGASRLNRSPATLFDDPLDLGPNPPRQNGSNLKLDALTPEDYICTKIAKPHFASNECESRATDRLRARGLLAKLYSSFFPDGPSI